MLMKHTARKNWMLGGCGLRSGFLLGALAALLSALPSSLYAQGSPLTVQSSTGLAGVGNTNPQYSLDVTGAVNATISQCGFFISMDQAPRSSKTASLNSVS